jgi:hypothetical protein
VVALVVPVPFEVDPLPSSFVDTPLQVTIVVPCRDFVDSCTPSVVVVDEVVVDEVVVGEVVVGEDFHHH